MCTDSKIPTSLDIPTAGAESFIKPKTPETPTIPKILKIPGDPLKILEIPTTQTTPKIPSSLDIPDIQTVLESSTGPKTPETPTVPPTVFKIPVQKTPIFHEDPTGSPTTPTITDIGEIFQENDQIKTESKVEENNESDKDSDDETYDTLNLDQLKDLELSKLTMRQIQDNLSKIGVHGPFEKKFSDNEKDDISEDNKKIDNKAETKDKSEDKSNDQTKDKLHSIWFINPRHIMGRDTP